MTRAPARRIVIVAAVVLALASCSDDAADVETDAAPTTEAASATTTNGSADDFGEPDCYDFEPGCDGAGTEGGDGIDDVVRSAYAFEASNCPNGLALGDVYAETTVEMQPPAEEAIEGTATSPSYGPVGFVYGLEGDGTVEFSGDICAGRDVAE